MSLSFWSNLAGDQAATACQLAELLRQGLPPGQLPQRLGITAARWQEIQEACSITVVALPPET